MAKTEFLLELFSEEIPARMQKNAEKSYHQIFTSYLAKEKIDYRQLEVHVGLKRITIYIAGLPLSLPEEILVKKGPKATSNQAAIDGFCQANNLQKEQLEIRAEKNTEFYFAEVKISGQQVKNILATNLPKLIASHVWPKSMYWGDYKLKWVRPLRNILAIFDGEILEFNYDHLQANNLTYGHRFMSFQAGIVNNYAEYKKYLADHYVILSREERQQIIKNAFTKIEQAKNISIKEDAELFEEVLGLAEYPQILIGNIRKDFLQLPEEILITAMKSHQRYFSVYDQDGKFAPYFIFIANIKSDSAASIIAGNEKLLAARLEDALYFYRQGLKNNSSLRIRKLATVIFHEKLGSMQAKTARLEQLCAYLAPDNAKLARAASLCKNDLVSEIVGEFPSLQGIMGYYYALAEGEKEEIAAAIRDHYKPQGKEDVCAKNLGALLSLADKIDNLVSLIIAGQKPTSSKDPYALRRDAVAIIRLISENKLEIDLSSLLGAAINLHGISAEQVTEYTKIILEFIEERVRYFFKQNYSAPLISATLNLASNADILDFAVKIQQFDQFINHADGVSLLQSFKRIDHILAGQVIEGKINTALFKKKQEIDLYQYVTEQYELIDQLNKNRNYQQLLTILARFNSLLADFFEHVLVKDEDQNLAKNRMILLAKVQNLFNKVARFERL